jgi:hypothetical protein
MRKNERTFQRKVSALKKKTRSDKKGRLGVDVGKDEDNS